MKASGHHRKQKAKINVFLFFFFPPKAYVQNVSHGHSLKQVDTLNFHTQAINWTQTHGLRLLNIKLVGLMEQQEQKLKCWNLSQ